MKTYVNVSVSLGIVALGLATPLAASAADGAQKPAAKTPLMLKFNFTNMGGVRSWRVGGDTVIFIKNKSDQWFRAEMDEACMKLDTTKGVNFITEIDPATNATTSAVVVDRHICHVTSLTKVAPETVPTK